MEDRLQKFAKLVDYGSYTRTAKELHISQPALSIAIQKLERELHAALVVRGSRPLQLTAAGRLAYESAQQAAAHNRTLRLRIAEASDTVIELRVGMIDSIAELLFVGSSGGRPGAATRQLSLVVDNTTRLLHSIAKGELDIALITDSPAIPAAIAAERIGAEPMVLVTAASQSGSLRDQLKKGHLQDFLGYNRNSNTYRLIHDYLQTQNVAVSYGFYSTSPHIILEFLLQGQGVSVLPYSLVRHYAEKQQLAIVPLGVQAFVERSILAIHQRERYMPKRAQMLVRDTALRLRGLQPAMKVGIN